MAGSKGVGVGEILAKAGPVRATELPPFEAAVARCDRHGEYAANMRDEQGRVRWYPTCPLCLRDAEMERIIGRTAIPLRFQDRTFDNYQTKTEKQRIAREIVRSYAEEFKLVLASGRCLILVGHPGTGKTHLAAAALNAIVFSGYSGLYATVPTALRRVKDTWSRTGGDRGERERDALFAFVKPDLLMLDEVGVQFGSDAERMILFEIINGRYEQKRPTVIASNLDVKGVEENIGYRAVDRLRENGGRVVAFDWESHRRSTA